MTRIADRGGWIIVAAAREQAWTLIAEQYPRFEGYLGKTDRQFPVLRLTPLP